MTPILEIKALSKRFGGIAALTDVDLLVDTGEILGLIGPNGSGKSTLFNVITGFLRPTSGSVTWLDEDITNAKPHQLAHRGLVRTFQERMAFDGLSVQENLEIALIQAKKRGDWPARVRAVMDAVGLPQRALRQQAKDLSWGQGRLLGMALALLFEPRLVLLDEPFAGLNRVAAQDVCAVILSLREQGISAVIVEHEMELLLPLCDRVMVLAEGIKIAEGPKDEILKRPEVRLAYFGSE
jgi:branched-chain amino acid transport system ATP-binding protein